VRIDTDASFVHFVYPFLFAAETFAARAQAVERAQWQRGERSLAVWQTDRFPEDELLAHVARYLNPPEDTPATARLWDIGHDALRSPRGLGAGAENPSADWALTSPKGDMHFRLGAVQLVLFRIGVGFLTVHARPLSQELGDWLDFVHYFRFLQGQRGTGVRAQRRVGRDQVAPFFPEPAGGVAPDAAGQRVFGQVLDTLLRTGAEEGEEAPWWCEVFIPGQLLPFAVFYVDNIPTEEIPPLVYKVRNFFHQAQGENPAAEELRLDHPSLLAYAEHVWFAFSLDGGAFVACDAPRNPFWRETLPQHLRDQYFLLLLLALHQRFALTGISEQVAEHWLVNGDERSEEEREAAFTRIRDGLLSFIARGYFTQVMQREHHHRCYRRWHETFQVQQLYEEVCDEVREISNYLLLRRSERIERIQELQRRQMEAEARAEAAREQSARARAWRLERWIGVLGMSIGIPSLLLGFLGINLSGLTATEGMSISKALLWGGISLGVGLVLSAVIVWVGRRAPTGQDGKTRQ
jgi:hypothetical protein